MKVTTSERQRRILVRVAHSEDLLEALEDLAHGEDIRRAWIRGVGTLERASLEHIEVDEPCEILSLEGGIGWDDVDPVFRLRVTLAPLAGGFPIVGGVLEKAPAIDVDLFVECFDDVPVEVVRAAPKIESTSRTLVEPAKKPPRRRASSDPAPASPRAKTRTAAVSAAPALAAPAPAAAASGDVGWGDVAAASGGDDDAPVSWGDVAAASGGDDDAPVSWADVAAVSSEEEPEPEFEALPRPKQRPQPKPYEPPPMPKKPQPSLDVVPAKGDFVQHRQFGLCKIEKTDGRGGIVIKLSSGVRKTIRLDFMDVGRPREERGRTVYPVRPRKR